MLRGPWCILLLRERLTEDTSTGYDNDSTSYHVLRTGTDIQGLYKVPLASRRHIVTAVM